MIQKYGLKMVQYVFCDCNVYIYRILLKDSLLLVFISKKNTIFSIKNRNHQTLTQQ